MSHALRCFNIRRRLPWLCLPLVLATASRADEPSWIVRSTDGLVAADHAEASAIGAAALRAGGNAFDAAVATSFALTICRPESTGVGGGGFMVAYRARDRRFIALDYREMAPAAATAERYARLAADAPRGESPSIHGGNAVGVPGLVAGLAEIHRQFGSQPWETLVKPAAELADRGFAVDDTTLGGVREAVREIDAHPAARERYAALRARLLKDGAPRPVGSRWKRADLAATLRRIADGGAAAFYEGELAAAIVDTVNRADGVMTLDDLRRYQVKERTPLRAAFEQFEIVSMPPPSSGGVCLFEALNVLRATAANIEGGIAGAARSDRYPPMLVHALRHAFADRARWLGDSDFSRVPVDALVSAAYAQRLAAKSIDDDESFGSRDIPGEPERPQPDRGGRQLPDDGGTSHFCVADREGNFVALTETINGGYGSWLVVEPFGVILNNQMDDFTTVPGAANLFGLQQGDANLVAPAKRPLSSMSPTLVLRDGTPVLALGASGGPRIITAVMQVLLNVVVLERPLHEAIDAPRLHHQWKPNEVYFDRPPRDADVEALRAAGLKLSEKRRGGVVQAIQRLRDGSLAGASDPRKGGRPARP
ncbi:MAG: gamma-glutamyltransferase [Phycisphaerae bacterium]